MANGSLIDGIINTNNLKTLTAEAWIKVMTLLPGLALALSPLGLLATSSGVKEW
jgi:hypothetical protein